MTKDFRIAPGSRMDFDLAGPGNEFDTEDEALEAAFSMDRTNRLEDGDEWRVYRSNGLGGWS